jgi:hypothetical protein
VRPSRILHRISKIIFALGADEFLAMLVGKIREAPFFQGLIWQNNSVRYLYKISHFTMQVFYIFLVPVSLCPRTNSSVPECPGTPILHFKAFSGKEI